MKMLVLVIMSFSLFKGGIAIEKSKYNLDSATGLKKGNSTSAVEGFGGHTISTTSSEVAMLDGGYFTIGTKSGMSTSTLDDNCGITFGHPFALTSYPVISLDGSVQKFDDFFGRVSSRLSGDTLSVVSESLLKASFSIVVTNEGRAFEMLFSLENMDTKSHSAGMGTIFDPALGQWGDGFAYVGPELVQETGKIQGDKIPDILKIWERGNSAENGNGPVALGMGAFFDFTEEKPDHITFMNWLEIVNSNVSSEDPIALYDLVINIFWGEYILDPGAKKIWKTSLNLDNPDFATPVFLRWDAPSFFSMDNNLLFPREFVTTVQFSQSIVAAGEYNLLIEPPYEISAKMPAGSFNFNGVPTRYQKIELDPMEIYEDKVLPVKIKCINANGDVVDELIRNIHLPATPVSETGLNVSIDSLTTENYPELSFVFGVENEISRTKVLGLRKENVFVYENGARIKNFEFGKDVASGAQLADVVFVLDISGSMGNEINAVRNNLNEFAETMAAEGYDFKIGVVTFSTTVDHVWDLTNDINQIENNLASINLWGGTEDSPAALYKASELSFREGSKRTIIWITDENYPEITYTKQQIVNRMLLMDITVHGVGTTDLQTNWFNPIVLSTGGNFYNINGNFRDIMLDVARVKSADHYRITYQSEIEEGDGSNIRLEIRYAGLGGSDEINYSPPPTLASGFLNCFPNPFNPTVTIKVGTDLFQQGEVGIYNVLGQKIRTFPINSQSATQLLWNATDDFGLPVSSGVYYVSLVLSNPSGKTARDVKKIMYLK
jgi:Mg-chelatase subunit ChlD